MLSASRGRASSLRTWTSVLGPRRARPIPRLGFLPSHGCPVTDYDERKRRKTITHIEQAERLVAEGERHIARQREIVAGLRRRRGPGNSEVLRKALELLQTLELAQQAYIADRSRLQAALAKNADTSPLIVQRPLFCVVLRDGGEWLIEAEWPDGSIEHVYTFKAHSDAANWLKTYSETWLQERM